MFMHMEPMVVIYCCYKLELTKYYSPYPCYIYLANHCVLTDNDQAGVSRYGIETCHTSMGRRTDVLVF